MYLELRGARKSPNELQIVCRAHALSMHTMDTATRVASVGNYTIMSASVLTLPLHYLFSFSVRHRTISILKRGIGIKKLSYLIIKDQKIR